MTINPAALHYGMKLKIGVMGSASGDIPRALLQKAYEVGEAIAQNDCVLVTGACQGHPLAAADGSRAQSGLVVGISPALSLEEHIHKYGSPPIGHDVLIFTGSGLMGREVVNIRSSDLVVIVGGRAGTLGELAIAYDEGKIIGVLTETGGITDLIPEILEVCGKETGATVVYESDPKILIEKLLSLYQEKHRKHSLCFGAHRSAPNEELFRTVRDFVCGMWIDPEQSADLRKYNGTDFHFCHERCAGAFEKDPLKYMTRAL